MSPLPGGISLSWNVVNYKVVFADGNIANVNDTNQNLHTALQAASTDYGIVTRFGLATYPRQ
ncbi:hypothetical protein MPER_06352, partial [Moniliophthora perniciosa FA553]